MPSLIPFGPADKIIFERQGVASGAIQRRDGQFRPYSVLYLGSSRPLASEDLTPALLEGALLENTGLPETEPDRYYTIVGGYYFEKLPDGSGRISRLFGLATRPEAGFNLEEGGSTLLSAEWELIHKSGGLKTSLMDETALGNANEPASYGWTLLADEPKPDPLRPQSGVAVRFFSRCPQITDIEAFFGQQTRNTQVVRFKATLDLPGQVTFFWNWGDGADPETTATPESSHRFNRPNGADAVAVVSLTIQTPAGCQDQRTEEVTLPQRCPAVSNIEAQLTGLENGVAAFQFVAQFEDENRPLAYTWDWADGSPPETTITPQVVHYYAVGSVPSSKTITLTLEGPGACTAEASTEIQIPADCPTATGVEVIYQQPEGARQRIRFSVSHDGPAPAGYLWDFGNGRKETVASAQTAMNYERPSGDSQTLIATVALVGPNECLSEPYPVEITLSGHCPEWENLLSQTLAVTDQTVELAFSASVKGPAPEAFFWKVGDLPEVQTTAPSYNHLFSRPEGLNQEILIVARFTGPGLCQSPERSVSITLPGLCPVVTSIDLRFANSEQTQVEVVFTALFTGPAPDQFVWDFGNGQTAETPSPQAQITFTRLESGAQTYLATVVAMGPGACQSPPVGVDVMIPEKCPEGVSLSSEILQITDEGIEIGFTVQFNGLAPARFYWEMSQGQTSETIEPALTWTFNRPTAQNEQRRVSVTFSGPGDCMGGPLETEIVLPARCPKVLELKALPAPPAERTQEVVFEVSLEGVAPVSYAWNWGDGSPEALSAGPEAAHVYQREPGDTTTYEVSVRIIGPDACESHAKTSVQVAGLCPEITSSEVVFGESGMDYQEVTLTLLVGKAQPERYLWDWGDGSTPEMSSESIRAHRYPRLPGDGKAYTATIRLEGPGACRTLGSVPVTIPGICPVWRGLTLAIQQTTDTEALVQATLDGNGILAEQYLWNWGDGSQAQTTRQPSASHLFTRQPGDPLAYPVTVTTTGPDSCQASLNGTVSIPGICPEITGITPVFGQSDPLTQEVQVHLSLKSIGAQTYLWEWGDDQITETQTPSATHTYQRIAGTEKAFAIRVTATGPGQCTATATTQVSVGPLCPMITDVQVNYGLTSPTTQEIGVHLALSFGEGVKYVWEWGDGTDPVTTVLPTASRVFVRQPGDPRMYLIRVTAEGPGVCRTHATVQARVPGICPEVLALNAVYGTPDDQHQPVTLTAELQQAFEGVVYEWNWGDESATTLTNDAQATHSYARFPGDARAYTPKLVVRGPGSCETQVVTRVDIPGLCPSIVRVDVSPGIMTDEVYEVALTAQLAGPAPASLRWEWGDGLVDENAGTQITHLYQRQPGDAVERMARLTILGPGSCAASTEVVISVPGFCPVISDLTLRELETEMETEYPVEASLTVARTPAATYLWDWGDGTTDESMTPEFTHVYARELGVTGQFLLKVTASGPGSCESTLEVPVTVTGYCLRVEDIQVTLEPEEALAQEASVALTMSPAEATSYTWNWGDGSETETTDAAYASHVYQRLPGDPVTYPIQVAYAGPGYCTGLAETSARVNGLCPRVDAFDLILSDTFTLAEQPVEAILTLALTPAETYLWTWGDGTTTETSQPVAQHGYNRFPGDARTYAVSVHMTGPGSCITQAEAAAAIPGYCPVPLSLTALPDSAKALAPKTHLKTLLLEVGDAPATTYRWDWGDGTVEDLTTNEASHTYLRPQGEKQEFTVTVTLLGPDSCQSSIETTVEIQGRCPILIGKNFQTVEIRSLEEVVAFTLTLEDAERVPEGSMEFEWTFDSPAGQVVVLTKTPVAELVLTRFAQDRLLRVDVKAKGPGVCEITTCFTVPLSGRCPVVESVEKQVCGAPGGGFTYHFEAIFRATPVPAGYPERYIWNWGDGSPETVTSRPEATHTFAQTAVYQSLTAQVTLHGPGCDCGSRFSFPVEIPGECPMITGVYATYAPAYDGFQEVTLTPVVRNGRPQRYDWDFGDGSPVLKTAVPFVRHVFPLTQTAFIVRLTIQGAEGKATSCAHTFERRVELELKAIQVG